MSFWDTSTGESAVTNETKFEVEGGGDFDPIPEGSNVLAMIEEAKWTTVQDGTQEFVNIKWTILKPESHANRKIFQKNWLTDLDPGVKDKQGEFDREKAIKKRDRNLRMFSAIDANAGGRLAKIQDKPTNEQLALALHNKMMVLGLGVFPGRDGSKGGNWVRAVSEKTSPVSIAEDTSAPKKAPANGFGNTIADEIPF